MIGDTNDLDAFASADLRKLSVVLLLGEYLGLTVVFDVRGWIDLEGALPEASLGEGRGIAHRVVLEGLFINKPPPEASLPEWSALRRGAWGGGRRGDWPILWREWSI